jgi:hypothetical protein
MILQVYRRNTLTGNAITIAGTHLKMDKRLI